MELYVGQLDSNRSFIHAGGLPMTYTDREGTGCVYTGMLPSERSGQQGFSVRVLPYNQNAVLPQELPLITWE